MSTDNTCEYCGQVITLVPRGQHYKWMTNPKRPSSWCCPTPESPVRSHRPATTTTT